MSFFSLTRKKLINNTLSFKSNYEIKKNLMPIKKKIAILGASRGFGLAISQYFANQDNETHLFLVSRKIKNTLTQLNLKNFFKLNPKQISIFSCDFSDTQNLNPLLNELKIFKPNRIIYVSGGGPYGQFQSKKWKDHCWALNVNFLFPGELLYRVLESTSNFDDLLQVIFIGSAIAEDHPDPKSSSYAAAKHGIKGLITSVQQEDPPFDLRLFSPGYIDTTLLPPNAHPRQNQKKIHNTDDLAQILYNWSNNAEFKNQHLQLDLFSK